MGKYSPPVNIHIDPDSVFAAIEADRRSGVLAERFTNRKLRYVMSDSQPGYLEQIDARGVRTVGEFHNGEFIRFDGDAER